MTGRRASPGGRADRPIRVLIVDDHALFAEAIRLLLEGQAMEVLDSAGTAAEALAAASMARPDVILVDIRLPDMSGITLGRKLIEKLPAAKIIALTSMSDAATAREALRSGFHGYLTKQTSIARLVRSISSVVDEDSVSERHWLVQTVPQTVEPHAPERNADQLSDQLTEREREVLALLVEGASGEEIARRLWISRNTVRSHVGNILAKLQVHSRLEAVTFAIRHGLVAPSEGSAPT